MTETRSWPELQEELSRKVLDTLEQKAFQHDIGELSDREFWHVCDALYDSITGLVPWDVANAVYAVRQELGQKSR